MLFSLLEAIKLSTLDSLYAVKLLHSEANAIIHTHSRAKSIWTVVWLVFVYLITLTLMCYVSQSIMMAALFNLILFDLLYASVAMLCVWTEKRRFCYDRYTFGSQRFEVVGVFSSAILSILSSFFIIKESVERLFEPERVTFDYLIINALISFLVHNFVIHSVYNPAMDQTMRASSPNWIQENLADLSRPVCRWFPGLERHLLPRVNPLSLAGCIVGALGLYACLAFYSSSSYFEERISVHSSVLDGLISDRSNVDTLAGMASAFVLILTLLPLAISSGRVLLQTAPADLTGPLDKALRDCARFEGVLELRNEHFWLVDFDTLAGSVWVRVKRDADEQAVLASVTNRLSQLVKLLTVQVMKDTWSQASHTHHDPSSACNSHAHSH